MAGGNAIGRGEFRCMMAAAVSIGALDLRDAARVEAAILDRCAGSRFVLGAAALLGLDRIALVRSTLPGSRNTILHAYLVVDGAGAHRSQWLLADATGTVGCGVAADAWRSAGAALSFEDAPRPPRSRLDEAVVAFLLPRMPWFGSSAAATAEEAPDYAVADLATFVATASRRGEAALLRWLEDRLRADAFEYASPAGKMSATSSTADRALFARAATEGGHLPPYPP